MHDPATQSTSRGVTVVVVAANIVLIPRIHVLGPAVATLAAECVVVTMLAFYARSLAGVGAGRAVAAAGAAALLMAGVIVLVRPAPVAVQTAIGAAAYACGVVAFRGLTQDDIALIRELAGMTPVALPGVFE